MWAYKYMQKETKLQVPSFKSFFYENQELLALWFENESEELLEDRPPFAMRCLKYLTQLSFLLVSVILLVDAKDMGYSQNCEKRLECFNNCNNMYFPSLFCDGITTTVAGTPIKIELNGNVFDTFYKFPEPNYVSSHNAAVTSAKTLQPTYALDMTSVGA